MFSSHLAGVSFAMLVPWWGFPRQRTLGRRCECKQFPEDASGETPVGICGQSEVNWNAVSAQAPPSHEGSGQRWHSDLYHLTALAGHGV